jgi:hypothetical protein
MAGLVTEAVTCDPAPCEPRKKLLQLEFVPMSNKLHKNLSGASISAFNKRVLPFGRAKPV